MCADHWIDVVDDDIFYAETIFYLLGNIFGILDAISMRYEYHLLAQWLVACLLHMVNERVQGFLSTTYLV